MQCSYLYNCKCGIDYPIFILKIERRKNLYYKDTIDLFKCYFTSRIHPYIIYAYATWMYIYFPYTPV